MFISEKVKDISIFTILSLVCVFYWGLAIVVLLYGNVATNAVFCFVHAHSAYTDKGSHGSYDAVMARIFFASTMAHGVMSLM